MNYVGMSLAVLIFASWGVGEGVGSGCQSFSVPTNATKIGDLDLYVVGTKVEKLPAPTASASAPRLIAITAKETGAYTFVMHFEVESVAEVEYVYLGFGTNGIYKAKVRPQAIAGGSADTPITACGLAASQQGITCTAACLSACSCLVCPDKQIELNAEQACAFNCTNQDNHGLLDTEPYYGSEKNFASFVYNGFPAYGITGIAAAGNCSTSNCAEAPKPGTKRTKSVSLDFSTPITLSTATLSASMVETSATASDPVSRSEGGAAASVSISRCPGLANCDP